mmetsp:Transcript_39576/g.93961  ORF Transcript_39576/g.93961 Transcript_39576/m.93961 type:complete len:239 (+) Transcript_39576:460-1176(+)
MCTSGQPARVRVGNTIGKLSGFVAQLLWFPASRLPITPGVTKADRSSFVFSSKGSRFLCTLALLSVTVLGSDVFRAASTLVRCSLGVCLEAPPPGAPRLSRSKIGGAPRPRRPEAKVPQARRIGAASLGRGGQPRGARRGGRTASPAPGTAFGTERPAASACAGSAARPSRRKGRSARRGRVRGRDWARGRGPRGGSAGRVFPLPFLLLREGTQLWKRREEEGRGGLEGSEIEKGRGW